MSLKTLAKNLRKESTEAETLLWRHLRNRQINNAKFRRQHIIGSYIVDFVCLEKNLIIELDGGHHSEQKKNDDIRTSSLESQGYNVIRFWNDEVLNQIKYVLEAILHELNKHPSPQPSPLKGGRE